MKLIRIDKVPAIALTVIALCLLTDSFVHPMPSGYWVQSCLRGDAELGGVYHGLSYAAFEGDLPEYEQQDLAKNRALDDLCYKLAVSVTSKFEDRIVKKGDYEAQNIISSLYVSTRHFISGIEAKDIWTDAKSHRYWVLLVVDKGKADKQLAQQRFINEVVDRLEHKQDEILEGIKEIAAVLQNNIQAYNDSIDKLEGLINAIDSKMQSASSQTRDEYATIQADIKKLQDERQRYENIIQNGQQQQQAQIEHVINQNNELKAQLAQIAAQIQKDYFLSLARDDLQAKADDPGFAVRIRPGKGDGADYYSGEKITFFVSATRDCYIKVIYISSTGSNRTDEKRINTVLFPNAHDRNNRIKAGETVVIGKQGEIEVGEPFGQDVVSVVASEQQFTDIASVIGNPAGGMQSETTASARDAIGMRYRGLKLVTPSGMPAGKATDLAIKPDAVATDTCFLVSHPR
jgi:hypothetical protein